MAEENPTRYTYHKESGDLDAMSAGKDDGTQLDAWTVGELAYVELGAEGNGVFSGYDIYALGGIPEPHRRNSKGKISGDIQAGDPDGDGTVNDVKKGAQIRIRLTDYSHTQTIAETEWFDVTDIEQSDPAKLPTMEFDGIDDAEFASQGRHAVVEYRNKRFKSQASYSDSLLNFPMITGREAVGQA